MRFLIFFISIALVALLLTTCRKDAPGCMDQTNPDCVNYIPCWHTQPSAGFKMRLGNPAFPVNEERVTEWCDTILGGGVQFLADMPNADSYTWQIGYEPQTRSGVGFSINFNSYVTNLEQNVNPNDTNYFNPLPITLTVRNQPGPCVSHEDTLITEQRQLVFARKSLTVGTFVGRVEGEDFDRTVTLWHRVLDLNAIQNTMVDRYFLIGLPYKDTIAFSGLSPWGGWVIKSYKQHRWNKPETFHWQDYFDGVYRLEQFVSRPPSGPDRVTLYYERNPEGGGPVQKVRFTGVRAE